MKLFWTHLRVCFFNFKEAIKVFFLYYRSIHFFFIDCLFHVRYFLKNPYRLALKEGYIYGETPLTVMDKIACECRILSRDHFYDLGCGRGRNLFWLSHFVKCQTKGVEISQDFVRWGNQVKKLSGSTKLEFIQEDFLHLNYENATVIYIYGTSYSDQTIFSLLEKLEKLNPQTKIITVSFSLNEYKNCFDIKKQFTVSFPWGKGDVYLQSPQIVV